MKDVAIAISLIWMISAFCLFYSLKIWIENLFFFIRHPEEYEYKSHSIIEFIAFIFFFLFFYLLPHLKLPI